MIPDEQITSPLVTTIAIPGQVRVYGDADGGYLCKCQETGCPGDDDDHYPAVENTVLAAVLHSYSHGAAYPDDTLRDALAATAGRKYLTKLHVRDGAGYVTVTLPRGLANFEAECEHCGWTWSDHSQPLSYAAAAVHAACAHTPGYRYLPDELLDLLEEVLSPRRQLAVEAAVTAAVAAAEAPLRERVTELETEREQLRNELQAAKDDTTELVESRAADRLTKEIDRTDAQIARSDVKPTLALGVVAVAGPLGITRLNTGDLPVPAAIAGWLAILTAAAGAVVLVFSVLPRIARRWGGFGLVTLADMTPQEISQRAHDLAADPDALADAEKVKNMSRLAKAKHRLVRAGMLITLLGGGGLAATATVLDLLG